MKQEAEAATVRIGASLAVPAVLRSRGADPAQVLAQAGVDIALFDDPDNLISCVTRSRLLQHCVERTGCRHFGLLVGAQNGLHSLGLLGLLMKYSPYVGTALQSLVRYLHLHGRGVLSTLGVDGDRAMLAFEVHVPHCMATDQVGDGAVAFMFKILRDLCGPDWLPAEAWFAHRRPGDVGPYQRLLQVPLRFDAEQNDSVQATCKAGCLRTTLHCSACCCSRSTLSKRGRPRICRSRFVGCCAARWRAGEPVRSRWRRSSRCTAAP